MNRIYVNISSVQVNISSNYHTNLHVILCLHPEPHPKREFMKIILLCVFSNSFSFNFIEIEKEKKKERAKKTKKKHFNIRIHVGRDRQVIRTQEVGRRKALVILFLFWGCMTVGDHLE